ncbi:LPS export ABC transporter periplasmic protein LptC [Rheinheimera sp. MMS21-TC3]|uniref:LPS export ABC transporter periplasmic protein LptC n=1 Tax=Rheinheimera sp. MMS21-TC3 TaxID=3072790 RepID=UPI0028C48F35|nr:LPS export ABC transporter periplasmic protein LptC [Rheinheimera sp. MMS21-TC3]WNO62177.1 LPS export ABC transporter periplasmic protein LptC [Rheinheimera sp. MMS21-TC3]
MRKLLVLLVLALVLTASYLWFKPDNNTALVSADQKLQPDYIASEISRTLYNDQGYKTDSVTAVRLEHFDQLGFTHFEQPIYTLYNNQHQPSWTAHSQTATWYPEDRIILEHKVIIESLLQNELIERIETDTLEMLFPDNRLQNNQPVRVIGKGFIIEGVGIQADLTNKTLHLLQHNKTVYQNES